MIQSSHDRGQSSFLLCLSDNSCLFEDNSTRITSSRKVNGNDILFRQCWVNVSKTKQAFENTRLIKWISMC